MQLGDAKIILIILVIKLSYSRQVNTNISQSKEAQIASICQYRLKRTFQIRTVKIALSAYSVSILR